MNAILNRDYVEAIARSLIALTDWTLPGGAAPPLIHLFTNDFAITPGSVPADFTAPTYTGYAPKQATTSPLVSLDPSTFDWIIRVFPATPFQPSDDVDLPQTIIGVLVTNDGDADVMYWAAKFDVPFIFQSADVALIPEVSYRIRQGGIS